MAGAIFAPFNSCRCSILLLTILHSGRRRTALMAAVAEDVQSDGLPTDSDLPTDEDEMPQGDSEDDELEVSWACHFSLVHGMQTFQLYNFPARLLSAI